MIVFAIVMLFLWGPIIIAGLALRYAKGAWSIPLQIVAWICILWCVGWLFQWIFFTERWWQLTSWMSKERLF